MAISILIGLYFCITPHHQSIQRNNTSIPYSITEISHGSPLSEHSEHPTCPSDTEWVEIENEVEGIVHVYGIRSEAPVWQIQNRYPIQNNQVFSIFQPEYTPLPPRQIA